MLDTSGDVTDARTRECNADIESGTGSRLILVIKQFIGSGSARLPFEATTGSR